MDTPDITTIDNRIIAAMRLILATSALAITVIDPAEPDRFVALTYLALSLYTLYSLALYFGARRYTALQTTVVNWAHWADVAWYTLLITLSSGTSSIFFFFFFFAILVASFRHGFREGLRVVVDSAPLFSLLGFAAAPKGSEFELNRFLLRPLYLFVLGYMMAYWGGFEVTLKRRLALLKAVNTLANPRFGVDRTTGQVMERLRAFFDADSCILVTNDDAGRHSVRRADRSNPERAITAEGLPPEVAAQLLAFPSALAVIYGRTRGWWRPGTTARTYNWQTHAPGPEAASLAPAIAAGLDVASFLSVPLCSHSLEVGRLYVGSTRPGLFDDGDLEFLQQVIGHFMPVIENIRLVDRLASDAAEMERHRIAHDLHDSIIQPYIGLQLGLTAIDQRLQAGDAAVSPDIRRLIAEISRVIEGLRGYVRGLKSHSGKENVFIASMRRFVDTFNEATGIDVQLEVANNIQLNDRLAAEVFQMVVEGLSNVRRHTQAMRATVLVRRSEQHLVVEIDDEGSPTGVAARFTPRSISERARALGGEVHVGQGDRGGTAVVVEIPL